MCQKIQAFTCMLSHCICVVKCFERSMHMQPYAYSGLCIDAEAAACMCAWISGEIKDIIFAGLHLHLCMHTFKSLFLQGDMHVLENASIYMHTYFTASLQLCSKMFIKEHAYAAICLFWLVYVC